mgnify:CR=1 FL=1
MFERTDRLTNVLQLIIESLLADLQLRTHEQQHVLCLTLPAVACALSRHQGQGSPATFTVMQIPSQKLSYKTCQLSAECLLADLQLPIPRQQHVLCFTLPAAACALPRHRGQGSPAAFTVLDV